MSTEAFVPLSQGVRRKWINLSFSIRGQVETAIGAAAVHAQTQLGGFSPGPAAILSLQDGCRVFAKAAGPTLNPDTPSLHRREIALLRALPEMSGAQRLLVALGTEDQSGSDNSMKSGGEPAARVHSS